MSQVWGGVRRELKVERLHGRCIGMTELAPRAFQGAVAYIHSAAKKVLLGIHIYNGVKIRTTPSFIPRQRTGANTPSTPLQSHRASASGTLGPIGIYKRSERFLACSNRPALTLEGGLPLFTELPRKCRKLGFRHFLGNSKPGGT